MLPRMITAYKQTQQGRTYELSQGINVTFWHAPCEIEVEENKLPFKRNTSPGFTK